jgi:hypothetical protein
MIGTPRIRLSVVVAVAVTRFEGLNVGENPFAETDTSYIPALRDAIEYDPLAAVVADPITFPDCSAWTSAPLTAVPLLARVTAPDIVPVEENVKVAPLLATPPTVTTTGPVVALLGTGTTIVLAFQLEGPAETPLKVTVLVPRVGPNPVPEIVTKAFTPPDVGEMLPIDG